MGCCCSDGYDDEPYDGSYGNMAFISMVPSGSYTWVCDGQNVFIGNYHPSNDRTAHLRLAAKAGFSDGYGGSIEHGEIKYSSRSLNITSTGYRDIANTEIARYVASKIGQGDYFRQRNTGQGYRVWRHEITQEETYVH
eukprot:357680_1